MRNEYDQQKAFLCYTERTTNQLPDRATDGKPNGTTTTINSSARFAKFPDLTMMASKHSLYRSTSVRTTPKLKKESHTNNQGECFRTIIRLPPPHFRGINCLFLRQTHAQSKNRHQTSAKKKQWWHQRQRMVEKVANRLRGGLTHSSARVNVLAPKKGWRDGLDLTLYVA